MWWFILSVFNDVERLSPPVHNFLVASPQTPQMSFPVLAYIFAFLRCHTVGITWCAVLSDWLLSLGDMHLRSCYIGPWPTAHFLPSWVGYIFRVSFLMSSLLEVSQFLWVRSKSEHSGCGLDLLFLLCLACPVSKTPPSLQELLRWHFIKMPSTLSHIWFLTFILSHLPPPPHIGSITSPTVSLCQFLKPKWRGMPCPPESC